MFEHTPGSHAFAFVGKYLEGYNAFCNQERDTYFFREHESPLRPCSQIVSMYVTQTPDSDLSRGVSDKHGVPIYRTVHDALTLGTDKLAVDGVLLIGEHGDFPINDKAQTLYPRFEAFLKITDVFRQSGRSVPVFNDKHLSFSWGQARRMVEISRELDFPFMAGSSLPVMWRDPAVEVPWGARVNHAVGIAYGPLDSYGFHALESVQCMVERRHGGETGVASVQCLEHDAVWNYLDTTPWAQALFDRALAQSEPEEPGNPRERVKTPVAFLVNHRDGLKVAVFMLDDAHSNFTVAVDVEGSGDPISTRLRFEPCRPHVFYHFVCQIKNIEMMFESGKATYPVERTLLTSGVLDLVLESRIQQYREIDTPQLSVHYQAPEQCHFCTEGPSYLSDADWPNERLRYDPAVRGEGS